jgi:hypothetical protein
LLITPRLINKSLTVFADPVNAVLIALHGNAGWLTALRADQHYIRNVDCSLELDAAGVDIATGLGLDLFLVLGADVHTLDYNTAVIKENIDHLTALAFIFEAAADDFNSVAFANLYFHT